MLLELSIENYALVRSLRIEFEPGFSAITGESGAGKSLLLGALGQVLGDRADIARISPEKTSSHISARFSLSDVPDGIEFLSEHGLENSDAPHECLLHRRIDINGRSRAYVNNVSVTLAVLRNLASRLVDIHAQDQHHALREARVQQQIFDEFAATPEALQRIASLWRTWQDAKAEADVLAASLAQAHDRASLLKYQVEELNALNLAEGEYEEINEQHQRLAGIEALTSETGRAIDLLAADDVGVSARLGELAALLSQMRDSHASLESAREAVLLAGDELGRAASELSRYADTLQADPAGMKALDERLSSIVDLARKHRMPPQALFEHSLELQSQLTSLDAKDDALAQAQAASEQRRADFDAAAKALSTQRTSALDAFRSRMHGYMQRLGLGDARIVVNLAAHEHEYGYERASFDYAASKSLKPTSLEKVASGGERSRLALAVALLAAEHSQLPSLVLDEADVGIGGQLTDDLGALLTRLGGSAQILMITHAPQIAALSQAHYRVIKSDDDAVSIVRLDEDERLEEISRMLGGAHLGESTLEYARTLLAGGQG